MILEYICSWNIDIATKYGVMANVLGCEIVVCEFEYQSRYYYVCSLLG